jgi:hypothetical protein
MPDSIFSTYRTGENRVTASILAVLRSLGLQRTERILGAVMERSEFQLVSFQNQVARGGEGVPDATITASCRLVVETKIKRNTVKLEQLRRHLERLNESPETTKLLLVLTPDEAQPAALAELADPRVAWSSFADLDQAIDELLGDRSEVISEREAFLLRELQVMLRQEELVFQANDVVVRLSNGMQAGYVLEEHAVDVAPLLDAGHKHIAYVKKILTGGRTPIPVIVASLFSPDADRPDAISEHQVPRKPSVSASSLTAAPKKSGCLLALVVLCGLASGVSWAIVGR